MATGALSSLGLGSDGALSYDVIEQLKEADQTNIITPIETKIALNNQKTTDLSLLKSLTSLFQTEVDVLADELTFLSRESSVSGDSVTVSALSGSNIEDFDIDVTQLAKRSVFESQGFSSENATFSNSDQTLNFRVGDESYSVDVTSSTTIKELSDAIYDATDGLIQGTILNVGGENPYKLTLKSKDTGIDNKIIFGTQAQGDNVKAGAIDLSGVGSFTLNGVDITMDATLASNTAEQNAKALQEAIQAAIENDATLEGISVDLDSTGKQLVITNVLGGKVEFGGTKLADIGLDGNSAYPSTTSSSVDAGAINVAAGELTINGVDIVFNTNDTAENNAEALRAAIQAKIDDASLSNITVSRDGDKITLQNLDGGNILIAGDKADELGLNNKSVDNTLLTNLGLTQIQGALDAKFSYNGIDITRSSNSVDDLRVGVTINLKETGSSSVSITQDSTKISESLSALATGYNNLMSKLSDLTKYDLDTGESGTFQGTSEIVSAKSYITRMILRVDENATSLSDYGLTLDENGNLSFDKNTFDDAFAQDPQKLEDFFRGYTEYDSVSYKGSSMSGNAFTTTGDELTINGVNIEFTAPGTSIFDNVKALRDAINDANISNVSVRINSTNDGIILLGSDGAGVEIATSLSDAAKDTLLANLGLETISKTAGYREVSGLFGDLNTYLDGLVDGDLSVFGSLNTMFKNELESYNEEKTKSQARIDTRYEMMATQFAAYDTIIAKLNQSFSSLSMMIQAEINAN
jgi:flagellar hook-associated protein 2